MSSTITKDQVNALKRWTPDSFEAPHRVMMPGQLPTAERVEQIHQQATEQGYQAGYTLGFAAARDQGERMAALVTDLRNEFTELDQAVGTRLPQEMSESPVVLNAPRTPSARARAHSARKVSSRRRDPEGR